MHLLLPPILSMALQAADVEALKRAVLLTVTISGLGVRNLVTDV